MDLLSSGHEPDADAGHLAGRRAGLSRARPGRRASFAALLAVAAILFAALGVWQVERRAWKLALIASVDARVHAPAGPAPGPAQWGGITAAADAYRHVAVQGSWVRGGDTLVQAVTERGPGDWVLTPLRTEAGWTVLVNRGFVPAGRAVPEPADPAWVAGLLRITEPGGGFLRSNDPAGNRWFSRDVAAIAAARRLTDTAPYFIDAEAGADPTALPVGGLTVVAFRNAHLSYALTWFALCLLSVGGVVIVLRSPVRRA